MSNNIIINGKKLSLNDIWAIAYDNAQVVIDPNQKSIIDKSKKNLDSIAKEKIIYGVNTGFGPMASYIMSPNQIETLQLNLIRSHATGLGLSLSEAAIRAIMVVRLNTLIKGHSAVSWELVKRLEFYINKNILPEIPQHGSVGASGDLIQLAHIALGLIGEGWIFYQGKKQRTYKVVKELGIGNYKLKTREGLALINGTSSMAGIGALLAVKAQRQYHLAISLSALGLELIQGYDDEFNELLYQVRPHKGQGKAIKDLNNILASSNLIRKRESLQKYVHLDNDDVKKIDDQIQDVYSLRCAPQIIGPVYETIKNVARVLEIEINSVTDNPIINLDNGDFIHGGNFHGDYVSLEMDKLKIVLSRLAMLSERQTNFFLNNKINGFLPPFLNLYKPGLSLALQGLQFTATSTAAEIQTLCFPNYVHSIPTNADNQDIVSMGTNSALIAAQVVNGVFHVQTIGFITLTQAVDVLQIKNRLSSASQNIYEQIRSVFKAVIEDRDLTIELPRLNEFVERELKTNIEF